MHKLAWSYQKGAGLLEIMLALSVVTVLLVMSYRSYQSYRFGADAQTIRDNIKAIQAAGTSYFMANCSEDTASLDAGKWQGLSILTTFLPGGVSYFNPWGPSYAGEWYQIRYQQTPSGNYIFCIQMQLPATYKLNEYASLLGANAYSGNPGLCSPSANSIAWESLPTIETPGYINSQIVSRLKSFRDRNNLNWAKGCAS